MFINLFKSDENHFYLLNDLFQTQSMLGGI